MEDRDIVFKALSNPHKVSGLEKLVEAGKGEYLPPRFIFPEIKPRYRHILLKRNEAFAGILEREGRKWRIKPEKFDHVALLLDVADVLAACKP